MSKIGRGNNIPRNNKNFHYSKPNYIPFFYFSNNESKTTYTSYNNNSNSNFMVSLVKSIPYTIYMGLSFFHDFTKSTYYYIKYNYYLKYHSRK